MIKHKWEVHLAPGWSLILVAILGLVMAVPLSVLDGAQNPKGFAPVSSASAAATAGNGAWTLQNSGTTFDLVSVVFADAQTGWASGGSRDYVNNKSTGVILGTKSGGDTWEVQYLASDATLNSLFFLDRNTGWAAGESGAVLKTTDGGATWTPLDTEVLADLNSVFFADASTGWVVGNIGIILKTVDGGTTWRIIQSTGTTMDLRSVFFLDAASGWVVGGSDFGRGVMLRSDDGGDTWSVVPNVNYVLYKVFFVSSQVGFAGGLSSVQKTTDGGSTWTNLGSSGLFIGSSLFFVDAQTGWVASISFRSLMKTTDGGDTWNPENTGLGPYTTLRSIFFLNVDTGWAVGDQGTIIHFRTPGNVIPTPTPSATPAPSPTSTPSPVPTPSPTPTSAPQIPNLSVANVASREKAFPGETLAYLLLLDNGGAANMALSLTDTIPFGSTYVAGSLTGVAEYSPTVNAVLWSGMVPPGGSTLPSEAITFRIRVDADIQATAITNTLLVKSRSITISPPARTDIWRRTFLPLTLRRAAGW